jgi:hypothetical protein
MTMRTDPVFGLAPGQTIWELLDMRANFLNMLRDMPTEVVRMYGNGHGITDVWSLRAIRRELQSRPDYHTVNFEDPRRETLEPRRY